MNLTNNKRTKQKLLTMNMNIQHQRHRTLWLNQPCIICGSKAIGMNFGVPTCAPCKAFFRRNARRKEILTTSCDHSDENSIEEKSISIHDETICYSQIRRCTSCRLRRCFEVGMKEELVRTDEENERHKQLVKTNRKRRELLKQQQQENHLSIFQPHTEHSELLKENDWRHLSNIVYSYDTNCLKIYIEQRANMFIDNTLNNEYLIEQSIAFPMSVVNSLLLFIKSLPAFHSLSRSIQSFLCLSNLRRLIFVNLHELNQSCFSEPWQISAYRNGWEMICGPELYNEFIHIEKLGEKLIITDPIVTRLWLITLFFSSSLFSYYDPQIPMNKMKKKLSSSIEIQNAYASLLWKYLLYRHGYMESVRIFSNLNQAYLQMLRVGLDINMRVRTQMDFRIANAKLEQLTTLNVSNS